MVLTNCIVEVAQFKHKAQEQCFLQGSRDGKFPGKFGALTFPVSREICVEIPGNFFTLVRVSVVLIAIIPT